ncbi:MAG: cellulase family glycosylhydrolase [bacterium]|nr:cellulase family glycosylhydrolase [bacterium]
MEKNFITTANGKFSLNGEQFRFTGTNMYELANVDHDTTRRMLEDACAQGFRVIRFWAFHPVTYHKLNEICELACQLDLKLIPVLADPGDYLQSFKVNSNWYKDDFKKTYFDHISELASRLKDREEILLWELINEPYTDSFSDFFNFAKESSEKIRSLDSNHLISIGTIGGVGDRFGGFFSRFSTENFKNIYSLKTLDAVSLHDYSYNSNMFERLDIFYRLQAKHHNSKLMSSLNSIFNFIPDRIDKITFESSKKTYDLPFTLRSIWRRLNKKNILDAKQLGKPFYIGEVGFKKNTGDLRIEILRTELKKYFDTGAAGVLLWSFQSQGRSVDGHDYGFDAEDKIGDAIRGFSE